MSTAKVRLLLVAVDYFPYRHSGDKNFWFDLLPHLARKLESVVVMSLNYSTDEVITQEPGITIHNHRPFRFRKNLGLKCGMDWGYPERTLTFLLLYKGIRRCIGRHNISHVHFSDSYGPIQNVVKVLYPRVCVTASAVSYQRRYPFHDRALRLSLSGFDKIITYSDTLNERLSRTGIQHTKLSTIKWGVTIPRGDAVGAEGQGTSTGQHAVWTGYTQQSTFRDFWIALQASKKALETVDSCHFSFFFKPEHFKQEYAKHAGKGISILSGTSGKEMKQIFESADVLLAPMTAPGIIVGPPLTWLEAMSHGVPVITTRAGGVDEIISHGVNGLISAEDKLAETIVGYLKSRDRAVLGKNARRKIEREHNVAEVADKYAMLWNGAACVK